MGTPARTGLTYDDLERFPDDNLRRELIGGQLFVTPAPGTRHAWVVTRLLRWLIAYTEDRGGVVFTAPYDVRLSDTDVVEPDLLYLRPDRVDLLHDDYLPAPPDLVVEVSSPSTRRTDRGRKRDLYASHGVPEYWLVDLDTDRVEVYRLGDGGYGPAQPVGAGGTLTSPHLPGLTLEVDDVLAPPPGG